MFPFRTPAPSDADLSAERPDPLSPTGDYDNILTADNSTYARIIAGLMVLLVASVGLNVLQTLRYQPTAVFVDVRTGRKVVDEKSGGQSAPTEAATALFVQNISEQFIQNRYAYEPVNLENKLKAALALMDEAAAKKEHDKIFALPLGDAIVAADARYSITLNDQSWDILRQPGETYRVTVRGHVKITNATVYREKPFEKDVTFTLILKRVAQTKENLAGLVVIDSGNEIL